MNSGGTDYEDNFILPMDSHNPDMLRFLPGVKGIPTHRPYQLARPAPRSKGRAGSPRFH
jgi:hypothetical protein